MYDLSNSISPAISLAAAVRTGDANGTGVDLSGYESSTGIVGCGAEGDTLSGSVYFEFQLEHSDDNSAWTDCTQSDIIDGTIAANGVFLKLDGTDGGDPDTTGLVYRVGYVGGKRYIRVVIDATGTHSNGTPIGAIVVKGHPHHSGDTAFTPHNA